MKKRLLIAMVTVAAFVALAVGSTTPAYALTEQPWGTAHNKGKVTVYNTKYMKEGGHWENAFVDCNVNAKITRLTSSNTKVAKAVKYAGKYDDPECGWGDSSEFLVRGVGKTTITAVVSCEGKTYTQTLKLTVKKWVNPLKTLKIGSKSYKAKFEKTDVYYAKKNFSKKKLTVTPAKNWKVTKIRGFFTNSNTQKLTKLKSGSKISFKQPPAYIKITCKNKKNGNVEVVRLQNQQVFG